jgi:hypothetical protein
LVPTSEETERITQAVIHKATRILVLAGAPLGTFGELTEFGMPTVRPDYQVAELLFGLRLSEWELDLAGLVTTDDVIRQGLQTDPATFPADRVPDVQRAIDSAVSWVDLYLSEGVAVG